MSAGLGERPAQWCGDLWLWQAIDNDHPTRQRAVQSAAHIRLPYHVTLRLAEAGLPDKVPGTFQQRSRLGQTDATPEIGAQRQSDFTGRTLIELWMCPALIAVGQVYDKGHDDRQILRRVHRLDVVVANQRKPLWREICDRRQPAVLDITAVNKLGTRAVRLGLRINLSAIRTWSRSLRPV